MNLIEKRKRLALTQIEKGEYQGMQLSDVTKCKGMTRRQAAEKLGVSYSKLAHLIHYAPSFSKLFVREERQSTDGFNGVLFEAETDEGEDLEKHDVKCWVEGCESKPIRIYVEKGTPKNKLPHKICTKCQSRHSEKVSKGDGFTQEDRNKVANYDPGKRGYLEGLDSPPRILKGKEFEKLAAEYLAAIKGEVENV